VIKYTNKILTLIASGFKSKKRGIEHNIYSIPTNKKDDL
jgi:hypothetical protein